MVFLKDGKYCVMRSVFPTTLSGIPLELKRYIFLVPPKMPEQKTRLDGVRLLDQARGKVRLKHYSIRTEQAYVDWIKRYIRFLDKRHLQPKVPFAPPARPGSTQRKGCLEERLVGV